jgi:TM2 domain-containing membrane protein YozV
MSDTTTLDVDHSSPKNGTLLIVLCIFFGIFGAHRFYAGKTKSAIVQLLTLGGLGIWTVIDFLFILFGEFTDADGLKIDPWKDF